ncbi:MAG TPA: DUF4384 domain-containing protein [Burkholderiaceae bacterium]|nr:DUF4384 domain-containing protein [Burkholderiaceae bacterium]
MINGFPSPRRALTAVLVAALGGCAAVSPRPAVIETAKVVGKGPSTKPIGSFTNFSKGLRCMDMKLTDYSVKDLSVMVEDISDPTGKANSGTKDMLISAMSDMTRRSRAIRLVVFGEGSGVTREWLDKGERLDPYSKTPRYAIRGSVSQFDDAIATGNVAANLTLNTRYGLGGTRAASGSVIGLDLSVFSPRDYSLVAGVTSKNQVLIISDSTGVNASMTLEKFGFNYSMSTARQEGPAQAVRTLVELASIELVGRLAKVPYWTCLGATDVDPAVQSEMRDWYDAMAANPSELIAYFQEQLRNRRIYGGPIDGVASAELGEAVMKYRGLLGLSREPKLTFELFQAYLNADHRQIALQFTPVEPRPLPKAAAAAPEGASASHHVDTPSPARSDTPGDAGGSSLRPRPTKSDGRTGATDASTDASHPDISLKVASRSGTQLFKRNAVVELTASVDRDAYLFCYLRDDHDDIRRLYPNRYAPDAKIRSERPLSLPGTEKVQLIAASAGARETVDCFASDRDIAADLPTSVYGTDFEPLKARSLDEVRTAIAHATRNRFA